MSNMAGNKISGVSMQSEEPLDEQIVQMGLAPLSRQLSQQPVIGFPIVEDSDNEEEDGGDGDEEYGFFFDIVSNPDEPERQGQNSDFDDTWSNSSSDSVEAINWLDKYGGWYFEISSWRYEPMYKFVMPDPRRSCNAAAAGLKEPLSLLTKYRRQRLADQSEYFEESIPSPSATLRRVSQVTRGSRLKKVQNVDEKTVRWA